MNATGDFEEMGTCVVRANYEKLAARYDEDRARWSIPPDDVVEELLVSRPFIRVLDLGCGTGRWLAAQRDHVGSNYAFHHFPDKDRALDEVRRVLIRGGVFRINNIGPAAAEGWWLYDFFPEAVAIDAARFRPVPRLSHALVARAFAVDIERESSMEEVPASEALADAERRVVSQLALLDDGAYERSDQGHGSTRV